MALLSKDAILGAEDREYAIVSCPEWGGEVRVRSITGRERDTYEQSLIDQRGGDRKVNTRNARAKLILLSAVDESGARLFSDDDLSRLGGKNARPLDRLFDAARKLSGLSDDDVEELTEDFDSDPDAS
ncbi:MAG: hypothetical protein REI11_11720 [Patulibacter sp.]|nr:hypothetical protein [Patulibacter sp.]